VGEWFKDSSSKLSFVVIPSRRLRSQLLRIIKRQRLFCSVRLRSIGSYLFELKIRQFSSVDYEDARTWVEKKWRSRGSRTGSAGDVRVCYATSNLH
jgi:hypothetical protein